MKTIAALVLSIACLLPTVSSAESPRVVELFGCNFIEGKDMDDLQKVIEYYAENRDKIGSSEVMKQSSGVWTPYRGNSQFDLIWGNAGLTLEEQGRANLAYDSSKQGQAIEARFNEVLECPSSGFLVEEILFDDRENLNSIEGNEFVLESYACTLNPGKSLADVDAALTAWRTPFSRAATQGALVIKRTPVMMSAYDVFYTGVWDNIADFTAAASAMTQDPEAATSMSLLSAAHRCESGLWKWQRVVASE